ncbi:hypothetical protein MRX96_000943 [Rhipicephalus microplus]
MRRSETLPQRSQAQLYSSCLEVMPVDLEQQLPWPSYRKCFFVLKTTAVNITVLCSICRKEYSTSKTCSSNLRKHLEKKHPTALKEFDSKKRKAEHGPTVADKRHTGNSSTQTLESCLAATSRPKALSQSRLDRVFGEAERDQYFVANNITEVLDSGSNKDFSQDIHLPRHRRCAAHTLNLVASVDAKNACNNGTYREMARTVFSKLKTLCRKQSQSVQADEATKAALGRHPPVPNATRWNSLFNAMKYIDEVPKGRMDATFDALSLPRLQHEESMFIDEYCTAMYTVAKALDILQGEQYMYISVLQPTLQSLLRYQRSLPPLNYCTTLASSLQDAVKKWREKFPVPISLLSYLIACSRRGACAFVPRIVRGVLEDADLALAAAVHPKFKLSWMTVVRKAATLRLLEEE